MAAFRRFYVGCATVVFTLQLLLGAALVLGAANLSGWRAPVLSVLSEPTATPAVAGSPTARPTAIAVRATAAATAAMTRATATPTGGRFTVEVEEAELNALLARQTFDGPVEKPTLALQPGRVVLAGTLTRPVRAPLETWGRLTASDGQVRVTLEGAQAGPLGVPSVVLGPLEDSLNESLAQASRERGLYVESVEVQAGRLRLTGRPLG